MSLEESRLLLLWGGTSRVPGAPSPSKLVGEGKTKTNPEKGTRRGTLSREIMPETPRLRPRETAFILCWGIRAGPPHSLPLHPLTPVPASKAQRRFSQTSWAVQLLSLAQNRSLEGGWVSWGTPVISRRTFSVSPCGQADLGHSPPSPHILLNSWRLVAGGN